MRSVGRNGIAMVSVGIGRSLGQNNSFTGILQHQPCARHGMAAQMNAARLHKVDILNGLTGQKQSLP